MKIAGVVNDYKEALDIEDIVKAFVIKKRIFYLLSKEKKKDLDKKEDSKIVKTHENNIEFSQTLDKKNIETKNEEEISPVFNVRGLI
ncbi:hypothetical protein AYK21_04910 [Thermoplasmatales archaeon SG8-52-2]|nr:MAG: hypothetical protein AYK21_04910 [Thermoplasmatales archaeon SG8-52-2]